MIRETKRHNQSLHFKTLENFNLVSGCRKFGDLKLRDDFSQD